LLSEIEVQPKVPHADCNSCPLRDRPFVPSYGPQAADVVCIGEAPGIKEAIYGKPFVGPSGRLLKAVLNHAGIKEQEVFFTNTVLCHPDGNENPGPEAIQACSRRLQAEITGREPKTILALGNFAARAVLGTSDGIMRLRVGPPKASPNYPNVQIIPTIHPAAALRASDYFPFIVTDIGKVNYGPRGWIPPGYAVATPNDALVRIEELRGRDPLTIDIEVAIEKDISYEHPSKYRLLCIGIADCEGLTTVFPREILEDYGPRTALGEVLTGARIICHNGKFDIPGLRQIAPKARLWGDTLIQSYILDERGGIHGLKFRARELLGAPDYALDIKKYTGVRGNFEDIPPDELHRYNAYDVALTYQLYHLQKRRIDEFDAAHQGEYPNLQKLHDFLIEASNALMEVETQGVMVNADYLESLDRRFSASLAAQESQLQQWVANPRSPKQVTEALQLLGVTTASTDVRHLQDILKEVNSYFELEINDALRTRASEVKHFIDAILAYRKEQKLLGTYIHGTQKRLHNGYIHPNYLLHGTTTGRLSCRNPNIQNIPRGSEIRKLFIAAPGNLLVQADFKQGELRIIAVLSGDKYFTEIFAEGRDLLSEIAAKFYGSQFTKEQRVKAKNIFYGSMYGGGGYKLSEYANATVEEVKEFQHQLFKLMPKVRRWQEETQAKVLAGNDLITAFGRHRRYLLITNENKKDILKECLAYVPQSTLSDICLAGLVSLVESPTSSWLKVRTTVHDSILAECPASMVDDAQGVLNDTLPRIAAERFSSSIPFPIDLQVGRSWGEVQDIA
jgi:uracil-DNA glycosylase family 4